MAANGLRRGLIALVLLVALAGAGVVLASGGALLQADGGGADGQTGDDAVSPDDQTVDTDRVNVTVELDPNDDLDEDLEYELVVIGEVAAANDAANDTVDCTGELCVASGNLSTDAEGEDLPRYNLQGVVTSATPEDGYNATVNGTVEGNAIEGLGLGAYNVSAPNESGDSANDSILTSAEADGTAADAEDGSGDESAPTDGDEETAASNVEVLQTDGGTSEDTASDSGTSEDAASDSGTSEDAASDGDAGEDDESDDGTSEDGESDGESASVTFDGCSSATVEGDAYGYEAGLRYYVPSGLDTSTFDESGISTPATVDGNDVIGDARTTDVVVESVLVLDEDFGVITQVSNPNYDDCVDTIEQQHADWEDEQNETEESADENASDDGDVNTTA